MSGKFDWCLAITWLGMLVLGVVVFFMVVTGIYWWSAIP